MSYTKGKKRTFNSYYDKASYEAPLVSGKVRFHPCQKPVPVLEIIIATHTNEGETVLDCFMSSGSTGQDAINLNRNFIGFELDNTYFNKALKALHKDEESK
ncbi:DNA methyltransferase [Peribacillus frigoritolerans]|uniref:DNA methyltransferase n=1 Tax=Peribacillus frigoritolerans TaxID=450367 RepID=UPI003635299C